MRHHPCLTESLLRHGAKEGDDAYLAAAVAGAALVLTTFATDVHAQANNDPPTVRVSYADLNLSTQTGRAELSARIDHAVDGVCGRPPLTVKYDETAYYNYCRSLARDGVDQQLVRIYRGLGVPVQSFEAKPAR
jgi:UrcA family protein